ncbi:MAG: hypothetical protein L3J63_00945 [Geopsychrobacter sp.]|nr:hypothetical protein [Geopsychrobacter sp.]
MDDQMFEAFNRKLMERFLVSEDRDLEFQFSARDLRDGSLRVALPQIRVVYHLMDKVVIEVLVMVNALALKLAGKAVQKAGQSRIELSYQIIEPADEVAMSEGLWELTYTIDNLPGIEYFKFEFISGR